MIWRGVFVFAGDREITSDAVWEAFAQALRRGDEIHDIERWVWRAAFKIARGELKHGRQTQELSDQSVEMPLPAVDLVAALTSLSPMQRGAVVLHHYAGYSTREAANILGSTASAVTVHLDRARKKLRNALEVHDA